MSKLFTKFAIAITVLIFLIEGVLLVVSVNTREQEMYANQKLEMQLHGMNKVYTQSYIDSALKKYKRNIQLLTLVISVFVVIGFFIVYQRILGRHLNKLIELNRNPKNSNKEEFGIIPNDELGELINSRFDMLENLNHQINENKKLVRILAHDLNNGLFAISGSAELLNMKKDMPEEKKQKFINRILTTVKGQKELLEKIKNIEAVKSNKVGVKLSNENFKSIFEEMKMLFQEKLESKKINLIWENQDDFQIKVDRVLFLNNVLNNLVSNSIKFTPENGEICVLTEVMSDGKKCIIFKDSGIGIPKDILDVLFDPNEKTTRLGIDGEKGTGFGMPLVKETLNSFGGEIKVESQTKEEYPNEHRTKFSIILD